MIKSLDSSSYQMAKVTRQMYRGKASGWQRFYNQNDKEAYGTGYD